MIYILIGEMGCGKSFIGQKLANEMSPSTIFLDGDSVIPNDILQKVNNFKQLSLDDLRLITIALKDKIFSLKKKYPTSSIVVSQALYRKEERRLLYKYVWHNFPDDKVWFYHVKCSSWMNIKNLLKRENGWSWVWYWFKNRPFFQSPDPESEVCAMIRNHPKIAEKGIEIESLFTYDVLRNLSNK